MFHSILEVLRAENLKAPTLVYYLERHIEVDGEEHGPLALRCLEVLTKNDADLQHRARAAGLRALDLRSRLWDHTLATIPTN